MGDVDTVAVKRHVLLGYTEGYAIEYLGRKLRPYWQRNGMTESAMLSLAEADYASLEKRGLDPKRPRAQIPPAIETTYFQSSAASRHEGTSW